MGGHIQYGRSGFCRYTPTYCFLNPAYRIASTSGKAVEVFRSHEPPKRAILRLKYRPAVIARAERSDDGKHREQNHAQSQPKSDSGLLLSGFRLSPELVAILSVYFVQGALGISRLAVSYFLKDDIGLTPAESAALTGIAMVPWLIKPLYGFLSDALPIFGYRRRTYLIGAGALGAVAWTSLASIVDSALGALFASILASFSVALSDVVVDSIVVERVRGLPSERSGALQSLCWGTSAVGGLISAYFSGSLLESVGPREIFMLTAILPLSTALVSGLISEEKSSLESFHEFRRVARSRTKALWNALRNPSVYLPVGFVFAWQATPSPESSLFFFQTNELNFGPEFMGRIRLISSGAALVGLYLYRRFFINVRLKRFMLWCTIVSVPLGLTQVALVTRANLALGISDKVFALTDSAVLTALGQVAFMPTLVLAAQLCPPGVEGSLFAALMSVYNASGTVSNELGAALTHVLGITESNFDMLWLLVVICSLSYLIPLPLLNLLDQAAPISERGSSVADTSSAVPRNSPAEQTIDLDLDLPAKVDDGVTRTR